MPGESAFPVGFCMLHMYMYITYTCDVYYLALLFILQELDYFLDKVRDENVQLP